MTRQIVNVGSVANDGKGDTLRDSFIKVNDNFQELFANGTNTVNTINSFSRSTNNRINLAWAHANSAYDRANLTFGGFAQISQNTVLAFRTANLAYFKANDAFATTNTVWRHANAAYFNANTVFNHSNNLFARANTVIFRHANSAYFNANAAFSHSNNAFGRANVTRDHANSAYINANTARTHANAGYINANTARTHANAAFLHSNNVLIALQALPPNSTVFRHANAAFIKANAAFERTSFVNMTCSNAVYAPLLIDLNNQDYRVDPNGNSKLANLDVNYIRSFGDIVGRRFLDQDNQTFLLDPAGTSILNEVQVSSIRDRNNINYYVDPSAGTRLNVLELNNDQWVRSYPDNFVRFHFSNGGATWISGSFTNQWWIRFGTQDNGTRAIFEGAGNFYTNGNITAYWSDRRLKKNLTKITDWRTILNGINGYRYEWNDIGNKLLDETNTGIEVGLVAQEVQEVLPQAAAIQMLQYTNKDGDRLIPREGINYDPENPYLTVREEKIVPVLVEAIKGLMAEIDELKKKIG
jgi:hypothetical protein